MDETQAPETNSEEPQKQTNREGGSAKSPEVAQESAVGAAEESVAPVENSPPTTEVEDEELQSIIEELETAKEELQSSNEELQTVNEELSRKNEQLRQTTEDLTNLLNNITMPVLILGPNLHIRQFTPLAERLLRIRAADMGRHISEIRLNLRADDLAPLFMEVLDTLATKELAVQDLEGAWYLLRARPYRTTDNKIDGVVIVLVDIDQIRVAQDEPTRAHDFARTVIESVPTPLAVLGSSQVIQMVNRSFLELTGLTSDRVLKRSFRELAAEIWSMQSIQPRLAGLGEDEGFVFEHSDQGRTFQVTAQSIRPSDGPGILIALTDISSRIQAERITRLEKERLEGKVQTTEEALRRSHEELQRLTQSLLIAQEEERRRIARDLHDDLTQKLGLMEMQVDELEQGVKEDQSLQRGLAEIQRRASELSEGLRRIAHELHPPMLEDLGLAVSLERLIDDFRSIRDMPVQFTVRSVPDRIPSDVASSFYRLAQEALHNVSKHAGDASVHVGLVGDGSRLKLTVQDEGVGFDVAARRLRGGLGLVNMQERVRLMRGEFLVESQPGEGTLIEVSVPLPEEA